MATGQTEAPISMSFQAIDIALIPSKDSLIELLSWSTDKRLSPVKLNLNRQTAVPHLTLAIGLVQHTVLSEIWQRALSMLELTEPLTLKATSVYQAQTAAGLVVGLNYNCPETLQSLHESVWSVVEPFITYEAAFYSRNIFADASKVDLVTVDWVKNFKNGTLSNYQPHITLGFDPGDGSSTAFLASLIGTEVVLEQFSLYQLGNFCTCNNLIYSQQIKISLY